MSDEKKPSPPNPYILIAIGIIFFLFLGGIGIVWASSNRRQPETVNKLTADNESSQGEAIRPGLAAGAPTAEPTLTAPLPPTAVATTAIIPTTPPLPQFNNPSDETLAQETAAAGAAFTLLGLSNTGIYQYQTGSFVHPIALEVAGDKAFLLDAGRVLVLDLADPAPPEVILTPGDEVGGILVLEPLDLALNGGNLLVLDRAGDVYRYDIQQGTWSLDRYDRPVEESSGQYFVAIDAPDGTDAANFVGPSTALLETNYMFTMLYSAEATSIWNLQEARSVDVSIFDGQVFVLQRAMHELVGNATKYQDTRLIKSFVPNIAIDQPRQIVAVDSAVFILDRAGRRLLQLDPQSGALQRVYQLPQEEPVSAFAATAGGQTLIFAGQDRLYFFNQPQRLAVVPGGGSYPAPQPHDPAVLASMVDFTVPIGGSNITFRDFQMPGAPRHYRLGVHHGLDFYWQPGTKVLSIGDGVVIRADVDYVPPTAGQLDAWWADSQERGFTSPEILDHYLGRQVWIEHAGGYVSRYSHLRSIEPGIISGTAVTRGQIIGEVGNSGSPASLESEQADAHLHFELWLGEYYLGQFMRPVEIREWIEKILVNRIS